MEGSGRNRVNSGMGRSSISDLFGRDPLVSQSTGTQGSLFGPPGSFGDSRRGAFPAQACHTQEPACRESTNREATATGKSLGREHHIESTGHNGNGSDSKKGQNESKNSSHVHGDTQSCFLSSSLYYGGRDVCCDTPTRTEGLLGLKKDDQVDDANESNLASASRGNWWQGVVMMCKRGKISEAKPYIVWF